MSVIRPISFASAAAAMLAAALLFNASIANEGEAKRSVAQHLIDKSATISIRNTYFADIADKTKHRINITTVNGVVLLIGEVPDAEAKDRLHDVASLTEGIRQVINEIVVGKPHSPVSLARDQWIRTKVKFKLGSADDLPSSDIVAIVSGRIAFMMGVLSQEHADRAVQIARNVKGVERVVSIFEIEEE